MSPTGPNPPTVAAQGGSGVAWTNVNNILVEDGNVATSGLIGPGGGGGIPQQLNATGFGFNIPSTAIIDGIKLELKVNAAQGSTDNGYIYLLYNGGGSTTPGNSPNTGQNWFGGLRWLTYGGSTSLWGKAWTPADINNANFGASFAAMPNTGTGSVTADAVRITVYWHTAPANVPKRYYYQIFNSAGAYLGLLPNVISDFALPQDINSAGSSISVEVGVSADTSRLPNDIYYAEDGVTPYTDEAGTNNYTTEGVLPIIAPGNAFYDTLIKNGNKIIVYEASYYYPNGKALFKGRIENWAAGAGDSTGDSIKLVAYSDGEDLDQYIARGAPFNYTNDQSQTSQNTAANLVEYSFGAWNLYGQTFTVGAGVTNIGAISVLLNGTATVTLSLYASPTSTTPLAQSTQNISVGAATAIQFAFSNPVLVSAGTQYFFKVDVASGQSITIYYQNTDVYSGGTAYNSNFGGGGGGGWAAMATSDLYFITASGAGTTTGTYTSKDPSTGMLKPIIDDYVARGGLINYNSTSVDATGLSLTFGLNTNTVLEATKAILDLSPNGFYWYVDQGTNTLYFKQISSTADFTLTKGLHLTDVNIVASIENVKNNDYFSGATVSGSNIYKNAYDATSQTRYGVRLNRESNNRVSDGPTAQSFANATISKLKDEQYQTVVTLLANTIDTTLLKPGKTIGFNGFGNFIDSLILQIVRVEYHPEYTTLTLGTLPIIMGIDYEQINRSLLAQQTVANPSAPS